MFYGPPNLDYERLPVYDEFGPALHGSPSNLMHFRQTPLANKSLAPSTLVQRGTAHEDPQPQIYLMKCVWSAYHAMTEHLSSREPEAAGILLGPVGESNLVTHFFPDKNGTSTPVSFQLDIKEMNRRLKIAKAADLTGVGIVHSHPKNVIQPSVGDLAYFQQLFALPKNDAAQPFFVPIFCGQTLYPYVYLGGEIHPALLLLI